MKILHVINGDTYSGAERVQDMLATAQMRRGHQVELFRLRNGPFPDFLQADVTLHTVPMRSRVDFEPARHLIRLIEEQGFEILHSHSPRTALICAYASRHVRIPVVHHLHIDASRMHPSKLKNAINTFTEFLACRDFTIISCSKNVSRYAERYRIGGDQRYVVDNGINESDLAWQPPSDSVKRIGTVGLQRHQKATDLLVRAFALVRSKDPHAVLTIIGGFADPSYERQIRQLAVDLNVADAIEWLGHRRDVMAQLMRLDVFVLPSRLEGLSIALLEAMSIGLPCVVSGIEENEALITNDQSGLIFPSGDFAALAEQILRVLDNPELGIRLGQEARRLQREKYSAEVMAKKIDDVYARVAGRSC